MSTVLAAYTKAWPFYFGLMFLATVLFVPGGITSLVVLQKRLWDAGAPAPRDAGVRAHGDPVRALCHRGGARWWRWPIRGVRAPGAWAGTVALLLAAALASRWVWRRERVRWAQATADLLRTRDRA